MIHVKKSVKYYINERALTFSENDLNDPQRVAVSLVSGTVIMVREPGIIDYASDGNFEKWTLKGYSTKLVNNVLHYVYARLSRTDRTALIVFSVKDYNIDGSITTAGEGGGTTTTTDPSTDYFYIKIGELTATDGKSERELTYDSGLLGTEQGNEESNTINEMWELDKYSTPWLVRAKQWLADFTVKGFVTLIGGLVFKKGEVEKPIVDIKRSTDSGDPDDVDYVPVNDETIPTTAWVESRSENRYLKKYEPDETKFRIKFFDGIECGEFVEGPLKVLGGSGTRFDGEGYGEMNGLRLREFLEVPELRFNRIDVVSGILWNSIAFGLVETVDENLQRCTLKLEDGERSGLKVNDICMGIFSDFGDGTVEDIIDPETGEVLDPGDDENGLPRMYGFSTSYFTPISILKNDAGVFEFEYSLQPGTSVHPKPSMKFAVYGNFLDERRQASAYSTRTYKRYLNKVNTWKVDPEKNIYAQFGKLDGLTISGMQMTGYGSYQHNTYFSGVQIQFTKEQKEDLKGQDAYSVALSDYVGIVRMASDGTVVGGEYVPLNVVSEGDNVITGEQNVVTSDYLLKTRIQAYRGAEELSYSEAVDAGSYIVSISPVGCVAVVENGVVCISEVTSMEYSYVRIAVNCEGNASFEMTYQVKLVKDGDNFIYADVDNEMDSVSCDKDGNVLFGLPVSCTVRMYAGLDAVAMDRIEVVAPEGVVASGVLSEDALSAVVEVTGIAQEADKVIPVDVYLYATYKGMQHVRKLVFTVAKQMQGENGVIYKLSPSATALKPSREDKQQTLAIYCGITKHDGVQVSKLNEMPEGYSMKYRIGNAGDEGLYVYEDILQIAPDAGTVTFSLYYGEELIDVETIPVLLDGNSAFRSTVFLRSNEEPSTPSATGSYESPVPEDVDGNELPLWSDGIPPGDAMLWSSSRVFSIDGLYPQEDGWSVPVRMTDTASFDVEFSSVQVNPGNPTDNPENWSNEARTDTWWMATRVMKNGEWSDWQISQIKGEKGDDGIVLFKSTVFIRTNDTPDTPTGGSYENPVPEDTAWSDGIPAGEEILWASTRTFTSDGKEPQDDAWSTPAQMTDTASFDVEFSSVENPNPPIGHPNTNTQWTGDASEDTIWMATSSMKNGEWSDWQILKIKGEKGEFGDLTDEEKDSLKAQYYTIEASVGSIGYTMTGGYSPSSFIWSEYSIKGSSKTASNVNYARVYGKKGENPKVQLGSRYTNVKNQTFNAASYKSGDYDVFIFELEDSSGNLISSTSVSVGKQGESGEDGSAGVMPRYCGQYKSGVTYEYNDDYRDIVIYNGNVFQVASKGGVITDITPPSTAESNTYWEVANKFGFVAMDTALIDNANIAGFTFVREGYDDNGAPVGTIRSQSSNSYVSHSNNGTWIEDGGFRKSPEIGDGEFTREIVTFTVTEKCIVLIEMIASSEANYDIGFVGEVDRSYVTTQTNEDGTETDILDNSIKTENLLAVSGTQSGMARIESEPGTYSVEIIYRKDSSVTRNEDCVRYRFVGSPKLWISSHTGTLSCSDVYLTGVINANSGTFNNVNIESGIIGDWKIADGTMSTEGTYYGDWASSPFRNTLDVSGMEVVVGSNDITARFGTKKVTFSEDEYEYYCSTLDIVNTQAAEVRRTDPMCGIHIKGNKNDLGLFIEGTGVYISPENGAFSRIKGLAFNARLVDSSTTLLSTDDFVIVSGNATVVTLPSAGNCPGKVYYIKKLSGSLNVYNVVMAGSTSTTSYASTFDNASRMFVSHGGKWYEFYCA